MNNTFRLRHPQLQIEHDLTTDNRGSKTLSQSNGIDGKAEGTAEGTVVGEGTGSTKRR